MRQFFLICVLMFFSASCGSTGDSRSTGSHTFAVRCKVDITNCFDIAKRACGGIYELRSYTKNDRTEEIEAHVDCGG